MLANWVKETTATTGTGIISLGGAPAGFAPFSAAFADGDIVSYAIEDGTSREVGLGTLASGSPWTITRSVVQETLVSGVITRGSAANAITLTGSATVMVAGTAEALSCGRASFGSSGGRGYYPPNWRNPADSVVSLAADRLYVAPYFVDHLMTIDALMTRISTAVAGSTTLVGLYRCAATGLPGSVIASAAIDSTTTGVKIGTISETVIPPGWYWIAVLSTGAIASSVYVGNSYYMSSPTGLPSSVSSYFLTKTLNVAPGWSELPSSPAVVDQYYNVPVIMVREVIS